MTIRRSFPTGTIDFVDPFLLFDHLGPIDLAPGAPGFPEHPHRGFETVTYLLEGEMEHRDSFGHHGALRPGDVQWMTAGSGLVHSEMPSAAMQRDGGGLHGFQIWVNLPRRDKMIAPHYQEFAADRIPRAEADGVTARVVAGRALGVEGAVETRTPILYVHFTLAPGAVVTQPVPRVQTAIAYVIAGQAQVAGSDGPAPEGSMIVFHRDADSVQLSNAGATPLDLLLLAGEPLDEPVARYGPFVMNNREEIVQAVDDYRAGKMGTIA